MPNAQIYSHTRQFCSKGIDQNIGNNKTKDWTKFSLCFINWRIAAENLPNDSISMGSLGIFSSFC